MAIDSDMTVQIYVGLSDVDVDLNVDLNKLAAWSKDWQMPFNLDKCKVMHVGGNNQEHVYQLNNKVIASSGLEKDLGVWTNKDLKCGSQCSKAATKANQMLGLIKRTIVQKNKDVILPLYKSLVRPHLDYCVPAWRRT